MRYINVESTDPAFNHALEEYFLKESDAEYFILWRNASCVLLGKNQNAYAEIDLEYVRRHGLSVIRRITGGGTVFNDLGNMNFAYIVNDDAGSKRVFSSFEPFTQPIISALRFLGVNAELTGRNDITVSGKKISGNAQARTHHRILHHGTLLFSANMSDLSAALKTRPEKFQGKAVKSVSGRVANICDFLAEPMDIHSFRSYLIEYLMEHDSNSMPYVLTGHDEEQIGRLAQRKYATWEWNFGKSPDSEFAHTKKFAGGLIDIHFDLINDSLRNVRLWGDFFGQEDIVKLEKTLEGARYEYASVAKRLNTLDINDYCANITQGQLCELLLDDSPQAGGGRDRKETGN